MKVMTILGTRPEIIRLSRIIAKLDKLCQHVLVHTGQNYDFNLNDIFLQQLGVRQPDYYLNATGSFGAQIARILIECERVMEKEKPDRFLVLGDTNSSLAAIMAKRLRIPVYHMEAGNRAYDDRMPEEVNRRIIDHSSDILLPYTERSRANLIQEGIPGERIYVTGNPIYEILRHYEKKISRSEILASLGLEKEGYFLVTVHRAEAVDDKTRLKGLLDSLDRVNKKYDLPVIVSWHPRTKNRMQKFGIKLKNDNIRFLEPFGFFDFITLEKNARCILTDSGTVQEECCIFRLPNVTVRENTERPETVECGSNIIAGVTPESILKAVEVAMSRQCDWEPPPEYLEKNVSGTVIKIILGHIGR